MSKMVLALMVAGACVSSDRPSTGTVTVLNPPPKCAPQTPMAMVANATVRLPDGFSEDEAYDAAVQFLVTGGVDIETKHDSAHVLVTRAVTGQTVLTTCRPVNDYRVYKLRIAVVGQTLLVNMDVWCSTGWEAEPGVPAHRDPIQRCEIVSEADAKIPGLVANGAIEAMRLRRK